MDAPAVPHEVAVERMAALRQVVERSSLLANQARIGRTEEVLVEGPSRRDPSRTSARTRQHRLVHFDADRPLRPGTYASVEITGASTTHVLGGLVEVLDVPRHRTRIPVVAG